VVDHRRTGQAERAKRGQGPPRRGGGGRTSRGVRRSPVRFPRSSCGPGARALEKPMSTRSRPKESTADPGRLGSVVVDSGGAQ
jgi:hypothetical protein